MSHNHHHHHHHGHDHHHHGHDHRHHDDDKEDEILQQGDFDNKETALGWAKDPLVAYLNKRLANVLISNHEADLTNDEVSALDFGCGTGLLGMTLKERFPSVKITGVDLSPAMIDVYKETIPDACAFCMNLTHPDQGPLQGKKFDYIFSCYVLHHCDDPPKMVKLLSSYLAPGGKLIFGEFSPNDREKAPKEFFSRGDVSKWLSEADLVDVKEGIAFECTEEEMPKSNDVIQFCTVIFAEGTKTN